MSKRDEFPEAQFGIVGGLTAEEKADIIQKRNAYLKSIGYDVDDSPKIEPSPKPKKIIYLQSDFGPIFKVDDNEHAAYRLNAETNEWQRDRLAYYDIVHGNTPGTLIQMEENYPYGEPVQYGKFENQ